MRRTLLSHGDADASRGRGFECACRGLSLEMSTVVGPQARHNTAAISLLRSEAGLNGSQIARLFGRTRQWTSWRINAAVEQDERTIELVEKVRRYLAAASSGQLHRTNRVAEPSQKLLPGLSPCRKAAGLSIKQLAQRAELPRETVSRLEHQRRRARSATAKALAFALGVSLADLTIVNERTPALGRPEPVQNTPKRSAGRHVIRPLPWLQVCTDCGRTKSLDAFTRIPSSGDAYYGRCKVSRGPCPRTLPNGC
jgi:transcriptional regulator with XRE-family HTH domain